VRTPINFNLSTPTLTLAKPLANIEKMHKKIPENIKDVFLEIIINRDILYEFEIWVYNNEKLKHFLSEDTYYDLISLNYKSTNAYNDLVTLLKKLVPERDIIKRVFLKNFDNVINRKNDYSSSILYFYDSYCLGYSFMGDLAFSYGMCLDSPSTLCGVDSYEELSINQKNKIVDLFYPGIIKEVEQMKKWIQNEVIKFEGDINEHGFVDYKDLRDRM